MNLIITQQDSLRGIQTKKKKENTVMRWGMGQRRNSAAQHNNRPTKRAGLPAWLLSPFRWVSHTDQKRKFYNDVDIFTQHWLRQGGVSRQSPF